MKHEFFVDCVTQAVGMGFRRFNLTPCTGDIFMDRGIFRKLEFLESNAQVDSFEFFTNFTILKPKDIEQLTKLQKLKSVVLSIYGHDLETFMAITKSTEKVYHRLVANLETLLGLIHQKKFHLEIAVRSTMSVPRNGSSALMRGCAALKMQESVSTSRAASTTIGAATSRRTTFKVCRCE